MKKKTKVIIFTLIAIILIALSLFFRWAIFALVYYIIYLAGLISVEFVLKLISGKDDKKNREKVTKIMEDPKCKKRIIRYIRMNGFLATFLMILFWFGGFSVYGIYILKGLEGVWVDGLIIFVCLFAAIFYANFVADLILFRFLIKEKKLKDPSVLSSIGVYVHKESAGFHKGETKLYYACNGPKANRSIMKATIMTTIILIALIIMRILIY